MKKDKNIIAVYGSLREGLGNHRIIADATFLGEITTTPTYSLFSLGGFPGLKRTGSTAVVMEVYEVSDEVLTRVNRLEGYDPDREVNNFYDRFEIETIYGTAYCYEYVPGVEALVEVEEGDWKAFKELNEVNY